MSLLLLAACSGDPCEVGWKPVFDRSELDRPILSLWGRGDEVYAVGGPVRVDFLKSLVLRWDGARWSDLAPDRNETLWWVWGPADGQVVWMVGEHGLAMRWDGQGFSTLPKLTDATLFGVWGSADDDVWLVGGVPGAGVSASNDVVLHWDGSSLAADAPPPVGAAFFKVWGAAKDDVWVVGEGGVIQRRTAAGWQRYDAGGRDALTTVHGCGPGEVYAVGGQAVYRFDGDAWGKVFAAMPLAGANGVHCGRDEVLVVGNGGLKLRFDRAQGRWLDETLDAPFYSDFHAAWISPSGMLWAAGGNYNAPVTVGRYGMLGVFGCPLPR